MSDTTDRSAVRRQLDTGEESPAPQIAEVVAELEGRSVTELSTMHECVDGVLDDVFSNPPSPEADLEISFNYEGYRITVEQDGTLEVSLAD